MNKKHISLMLAALMCFTSIIPSFAYDLDEKGNSTESVEYQNTEDEDYVNQTNVFAEIGSEYKVTIPKVIVLSGVTKSADYYVKVEGDIAGYETVNVVPDENVVLYTKNKASQTGTITQDKTSWKVSDFNVNANGEVSANGLTAGKWSGVFNFYINMESNEDNNTNDTTQTDTEKKLTVDTEDLAMDASSSHKVHAYYDGKDVTDDVNWSSDNSKITVKNGLVVTSATAQVGDTATITASTDDTSTLVAALDKMGIIAVASAEDGSDSVSFKVTIVEINFDDSEGAEIDNVSILPGENKSIKAKITPETTGTVTWSCTAPSGVTLQKSGNNVTIYVANDMPEGRIYNVIATYGDYSKTIELSIASTAKDNLSVSIEDGNTLTVGDVKDINVTTTDGSTPSNVTITSSDENVAKIVNGKIEAVGAGNVTITINADGSVSKTIDVTIEESLLPAAGTKIANMSFSEIKAVAASGKAADYGIKKGDTIKINDSVNAEVIEIGTDYIEFATTSRIVSKIVPATSSTLVKGIKNTNVTSYGPAAFYKYPQVNYENKGNVGTVGYNNSDLQNEVHAWFDAQSDEFKASVKDTVVTYDIATLTFKDTKTSGYMYFQQITDSVEVTEKVYIPSRNYYDKLNRTFTNRNNYTWTSSPYTSGAIDNDTGAFGTFSQLGHSNILETQGSSSIGAIGIFRIG